MRSFGGKEKIYRDPVGRVVHYSARQRTHVGADGGRHTVYESQNAARFSKALWARGGAPAPPSRTSIAVCNTIMLLDLPKKSGAPGSRETCSRFSARVARARSSSSESVSYSFARLSVLNSGVMDLGDATSLPGVPADRDSQAF